ncbi:MAG TPA: Fe-S cluster assembly protein SufD [Vicinamibacterales bacterium]
MSSVVEQGKAAGRVEHYLARFDEERARRATEPAWLVARRAEAIARFAALGFPTTKDEEYRFTNVAPIAGTPFVPATPGLQPPAGALAEHLYDTGTAAQVVFVNGRYVPELSSSATTKGLQVGTLTEALAAGADDLEAVLGRIAAFDEFPFTALNTAFFEDAVVVRVAPHAVIEAPINVVFVSVGGDRPAISFPRLLVVAGEHSQSTVIESHLGFGDLADFSCAVTEFECGPSAILDHYRVQLERPHDYHYCRQQVRAGRAATFISHAFSLGGAIVRNDVGGELAGEGIDCTLNGLYLADGDTLVDNHTAIDHAQPHCASHEVYKGILGGRARGVFNGKIVVRQDAQKTDAKQTNKALLLSDTAQMNTKPQLEIFADDVKCTHGATVGQLDADALFYLRARGVSRADARALLIRGFAGDIVNRVRFAPLRERLDGWLLAQIPRDDVK